jgi:hypothetical protein
MSFFILMLNKLLLLCSPMLLHLMCQLPHTPRQLLHQVFPLCAVQACAALTLWCWCRLSCDPVQ